MEDGPSYDVQRTIIAYSDAANRKDLRGMVDTFAEDATLEGFAELLDPAGSRICGRENIFDFFSAHISSIEFVFQNSQMGPVVFDDGEARTEVMVTEFAQWPGQPLSVFLGRYHDRLIRTEQGWRFASRRLVPTALFQAKGELTTF